MSHQWLKEYVLPDLLETDSNEQTIDCNAVDPMKPHRCLTCGKAYKRKYGLHRHVTYECLDSIPLFECQLCSKKFKRKDILDRHLQWIHHSNKNT
ncbi:hypothetical protein V9T40_010886 [Parthenolecanium corni]|uniref:C2H2-type domain-containing protein n=1 Tax=Parthenolecanium corni TaxID=536013 RepID=A0AAN9T6W8_9HEMI